MSAHPALQSDLAQQTTKDPYVFNFLTMTDDYNERELEDALVAKTDIDLIELDKGDIKPSKIVDQLMDTMEQYANFGFDFIKERLEDDPNYFFKDTAFLLVFLSFLPNTSTDSPDEDEDELEEL